MLLWPRLGATGPKQHGDDGYFGRDHRRHFLFSTSFTRAIRRRFTAGAQIFMIMVMITKIFPAFRAVDYRCLRFRLAVRMSPWRATLTSPVFSLLAYGRRAA